MRGRPAGHPRRTRWSTCRADSTPDAVAPTTAGRPGPQEPPRPGRGTGGRGRRRRPLSARRKALRLTAWAAAGIVRAGRHRSRATCTSSSTATSRASTSTRRWARDRPAEVDNGSENILVLGSDSRSGANKKLGGGTDDGSARSDTAMIVHVYKGHKKASVVSIPRDTLVDRPACTRRQGRRARRRARRDVQLRVLDAAAPACAVKTVESITGIRMDHYLEVDFTGFEKLVDELGGVQVTTTKAINDPDSHLNLDGRHPHPRRRAGARPGPHPARRRRRLRPRPHPAPAGLHQGAGQPGQARRRVHQPHEAVRPRRHRHQGRHHRLRPRLGQRPDVLRERPQGHQRDAT